MNLRHHLFTPTYFFPNEEEDVIGVRIYVLVVFFYA